MKLLDLTLPSPAENLACDEALLDWRENGGEEILRFWESPEILSSSATRTKLRTEVNVNACAAKRESPFCRRCSGGGTVLQGRGCLNYALVLRIEKSRFRNISSAKPVHHGTQPRRD
jgi:lipoate-protein ligase A